MLRCAGGPPRGAGLGALTDLFYAFNFTVSESTPFDIEVAVDPEMLGKIFEELITGRHESGSYYTPRAVVAFMCREALKGDSLVAPDPSGGTQLGLRQQAIDDYFGLKDAYLRAHGAEKLTLRAQVAEQKQQIAAWTHGTRRVAGFDWQVEFAEVFADGGFDVVVANPPYVRQELIKAQKPLLKPIYPEVYTGTSDLYVYFYARALQMLRPRGMLAFISSNKWFRAGYGKKLRQHLAAQTRIHSITDFGDLPVFGAIASPTMVMA